MRQHGVCEIVMCDTYRIGIYRDSQRDDSIFRYDILKVIRIISPKTIFDPVSTHRVDIDDIFNIFEFFVKSGEESKQGGRQIKTILFCLIKPNISVTFAERWSEYLYSM